MVSQAHLLGAPHSRPPPRWLPHSRGCPAPPIHRWLPGSARCGSLKTLSGGPQRWGRSHVPHLSAALHLQGRKPGSICRPAKARAKTPIHALHGFAACLKCSDSGRSACHCQDWLLGCMCRADQWGHQPLARPMPPMAADIRSILKSQKHIVSACRGSQQGRRGPNPKP